MVIVGGSGRGGRDEKTKLRESLRKVEIKIYQEPTCLIKWEGKNVHL